MFEFHNCFLYKERDCFNAVHIDQLAPPEPGGSASAFTLRRDFSRRSGSTVSFIISAGVDDNV